MLTTTRGGVLTIGVVLAVYFASSGVDSLRIALNRAYNVTETRAAGGCCGWNRSAMCWSRRSALLALAFLIVLAPLIFATAVQYVPWLAPLEPQFNFMRYAVAVDRVIVALVIAHKWLPAGRRRFATSRPA